ncbi:uncharacterized protein MELLADRAFT_86305 [Melampsora larici-populina 98AG31]|uniref:Uncharacterized protein n=1 Tax=Melampsora larici-populina (strain 98AG31 / pathotype 3-4-7) TaxID=747676 RepID=F4RL96_MELLP|nr:uncharacterized protein MELLADRAFT_86305 [Melampsora larici-populina 98AG31]EGG06870.1 hypothetical protein MELLADRAFT_86305 [Melampsora larici-populina 98AG31]
MPSTTRASQSKTNRSSVRSSNKSKKKTPRNKKTTSKTTTGDSATDRFDADNNHNPDENEDDEFHDETNQQTSGTAPKSKSKPSIFQSRFPDLELDTFEQQLDSWTIVKLQEAILQQDSRRSTAPKEIKDLVKVVRMEFEKRILMIALMAGVPEIVIWNLVGIGKKKVKANPWIRFLTFCVKCLGQQLPDRDDKDAWTKQNQEMADIWHSLSKHQQSVFKDPYFFALANLPDYSIASLGEHDEHNNDVNENKNENGVNLTNFNTVTPSPTINKLSEEDKAKYQPLFKDLVNVEKVHLCHGKPESSPSIATLQKRSLIAVRKAHHDFLVVCQQNQISYYLTSASCGGLNGWLQTFSNNVKFAEWALNVKHIPDKFRTYVHGLDAAKEIEGKVPQASDRRKSQLGRMLNALLKPYGHDTFPKLDDPAQRMNRKGWELKIVQKPGSLLKPEELLRGHRGVADAMVQAWIKDIKNGLFLIETKVAEDGETSQNDHQDESQQSGGPMQEQRSKQKKKRSGKHQKSKEPTQKRHKTNKQPLEAEDDDSDSNTMSSDSSEEEEEEFE